jgi:hypothetical protein
MTTLNIPLEYQPDHPLSGRSVSVPFGPYRHYGTLFVLDGEVRVFANSAFTGHAKLEWWHEFTNGKQPRFEPDYESGLDWREKFERARSVEQRSYDAGFWNCEHFVNFLQGLPVISRQARTTAAVLIFAAASALALSRAA